MIVRSALMTVTDDHEVDLVAVRSDLMTVWSGLMTARSGLMAA